MLRRNVQWDLMMGTNQNKKNVYRLADESVPESLTKFVIGYLTKEIIEGRLEPGHRLIPEEWRVV